VKTCCLRDWGNFAGFADVTGTAENLLLHKTKAMISVWRCCYSFPLTEQTEVVLGASGTAFDDFASTVNFRGRWVWCLICVWDAQSDYYLGDGAGLGIRQQFGESLELSLGYLAGDANDRQMAALCLMVHTVLWLRW